MLTCSGRALAEVQSFRTPPPRKYERFFWKTIVVFRDYKLLQKYQKSKHLLLKNFGTKLFFHRDFTKNSNCSRPVQMFLLFSKEKDFNWFLHFSGLVENIRLSLLVLNYSTNLRRFRDYFHRFLSPFQMFFSV